MGKELRTTPVSLKLHRRSNLDGTHWSMKSLQPFFPCLEKLFKTETLAGLHEYGVKLNHSIESIVDTEVLSTWIGLQTEASKKCLTQQKKSVSL